MKCPGCGQENVDEANFCSACNHSFKADSNTNTPEAVPHAVAPVASVTPVTPVSAVQQTPPQQPVSAQSTTYPQQTQVQPQQYSQSQPVYAQQPNRPPVAPGYPPPVYYPQYTQSSKQPFTITDCYIIIGFVLAIIGIFSYAYILLPASIGFSIVGFIKRTNVRTLGLSIAGIVVGVVASLIKLGNVLNTLGIIPNWLSAGIFS